MRFKTGAAIALGVFTLSMSAFAADVPDIVRSADGGMAYLSAAPAASTTASSDDDTTSTALFSTLADYKHGKYWCCEAYVVEGPVDSSGEPETEWRVAAPFTLAADSTVDSVAVPIQYGWGNTTDVVVSIREDKKGHPGSIVEKWKLKKLSDGGCCTLKTVSIDPVALSGGTQYWLEVSTESTSDIFAMWPVTYTDQVNSFTIAQYNSNNGAWTTTSITPNLAFAIYGTATTPE